MDLRRKATATCSAAMYRSKLYQYVVRPVIKTYEARYLEHMNVCEAIIKTRQRDVLDSTRKVVSIRPEAVFRYQMPSHSAHNCLKAPNACKRKSVRVGEVVSRFQ